MYALWFLDSSGKADKEMTYEPSERELELLANMKSAETALEEIKFNMVKELEDKIAEMRRRMASFEAKYGRSILDVLPGDDNPNTAAELQQIQNELALYDAIGPRAMVDMTTTQWLVEDGVDEKDVP